MAYGNVVQKGCIKLIDKITEIKKNFAKITKLQIIKNIIF